MSNEHDHPTASTTQPGPSILEERTLSGIFVHVLGLGTGVMLPALVYLVAENEFTRENARNAFNWQVIVTGVFTVMFGLLGGAITIDSVFPEESAVQYLGLALLVSGAIIMFGSTLFFFVNFAFGLIAMGKAIFGTAWATRLHQISSAGSQRELATIVAGGESSSHTCLSRRYWERFSPSSRGRKRPTVCRRFRTRTGGTPYVRPHTGCTRT